MPIKTLAKFISDSLIAANWPGVEVDEEKQTVKIPNGEILTLKKGQYQLNFHWYSFDNRTYSQREKYAEITFPKDFDIRNFIFFKRNGSYKLSHEQQFKNILNPLGKDIKKIKLSPEYKGLKFYKDVLILPTTIFLRAMTDAEYVYRKSASYRSSTENYLSNLKSHDYSKNVRKRTTYLEKGEFDFLVDRLYIKSKKTKKDFLKYLDNNDFKAIELLITELLRLNVLSDDFLRRLNDYFIKERLRDIIEVGRSILSLKTTNLQTTAAKRVLANMGITGTGQLESVWQKYFERNLLYLIFTYKKVFPKIQLKDIEGDKKYPDFIGINHYNGLDIIEIKTHLKNALIWDNSHKNFYFSPEMSKAIVQTTNYMDAIVQARFQNADDQTKITQFTDEENLYHPRGIIVISSQAKLSTKAGEDEKLKRDFTKLRNSLHNIEILTFDEIINIADEYIKNIVPEVING
jgi:hypothetical protein